MEWINKIHQGDVMEILKQMPDDFVDMVITSPPYWGLRDYGDETSVIWGGNNPNCKHEWGQVLSKGGRTKRIEDGDPKHKKEGIAEGFALANGGNFCQLCGAWRGQLGLETHPQMFINHLVDVFREVKRVLKKSGSFYLNLGDTYGTHASGGKNHSHNFQNSTTAVQQGIGTIKKPKQSGWYREKQLMLIPSRVAIALQDDGWVLRSDIIWHKPNPMPSSVKDRLNNTYEHVFFLVKQRKYYYDLDAIRVPHKPLNRWGGNLMKIPNKTKVEQGEQPYAVQYRERLLQPNSAGKNPGDIIKDKSGKYKDSSVHSAGGREFYWSEQRVSIPEQKKIALYLKQYITDKKQQLNDVFGETKWQHWIRTDESGASLPLPEDWSKLKEILDFDNTYDKVMTETHMVPVTDATHPKGSNPGDFWNIITKPFSEAHFAVFPPELIETPIKASCPEWICKKCGKPRERILEKTERIQQHWAPGTDKKTEQAKGKHGTTSTLVTGYKFNYKATGWTDCKCKDYYCCNCKKFITRETLDDYYAIQRHREEEGSSKEILSKKERVLQEILPRSEDGSSSKQISKEDLQNLWKRISWEKKPEDLFKEMRNSISNKNGSTSFIPERETFSELQGGNNKQLRIQDVIGKSEWKTSKGFGTQMDNGETFGEKVKELGGCPSQERKEIGQSNRKLGISDTQQSSWKSCVSLLSKEFQGKVVCPFCFSDRIILKHPKYEPGILLDPFAGSGTACLVAKQMGRRYIGIELKPEYVKMAESRLRKSVLIDEWLI